MGALELSEYRQFTKPAELDKAINMLSGMVAGMNADNGLSNAETDELIHWCSLHENLRDRHPFSEILPVIDTAICDGNLSDDAKKDILWLCQNLTDNGQYYDLTTSSIQYLEGMVYGLLADGVLSDQEIFHLSSWLEDNNFLAGTYPFDELHSLVHTILGDGKITEDERKALMALIGNVVDFKDSYNLTKPDYVALQNKYSTFGICAHNPNIKIRGSLFCFTGEASEGTRSELRAAIEDLGGKFRASVSEKTDYLVVGDGGNPCWAYACYGRKVEDAIKIRKHGGKTVIVTEADFWKAIDAEKNLPSATTDNQTSLFEDAEPAKVKDELTSFVEWLEPSLWELLDKENIDRKYLTVNKNNGYTSVRFQDSVVMSINFGKTVRWISFPSQYAGGIPTTMGDKHTTKTDSIRYYFSSLRQMEAYVTAYINALDMAIDAGPKPMGCCSHYMECSAEGKCVNTNKDLSMQCYYKLNLKHGKNFYADTP